MVIQTRTCKKYITKNPSGEDNGFLVPIYNIHDSFFAAGKEPQQVYMTVISPGKIKGPHLHYIRTGCFVCIKGNTRFVLKTDEGYQIYYSGSKYDYLTVMIPTGTPVALQNIGDEDAYVLNMPNPAWTPDMNDEYSADFSDFDFGKI